jgi:YD repeat-containing protein
VAGDGARTVAEPSALQNTTPPAGDVLKRLVGHYKLVRFENFDAAGNARSGNYDEGRIMYDAAGNMSAQLMRAGRKRLGSPSTEQERALAYSGFLAYYGRYTIDPSTSKVTHHVEGSTNPNWVGTDLIRYYEFSADNARLMLSLRNAEGTVTGTLTWERLR